VVDGGSWDATTSRALGHMREAYARVRVATVDALVLHPRWPEVCEAAQAVLRLTNAPPVAGAEALAGCERGESLGAVLWALPWERLERVTHDESALSVVLDGQQFRLWPKGEHVHVRRGDGSTTRVLRAELRAALG